MLFAIVLPGMLQAVGEYYSFSSAVDRDYLGQLPTISNFESGDHQAFHTSYR